MSTSPSIVYTANSMALVAANPATAAATTAAAPRRIQNNAPVTRYLFNPLWQLVFSYLTPYQQDRMRYVESGFRQNVVHLKLSTVLTSLCSSEEISAMSTEFGPLDPGRKFLEDLAKQRKTLSIEPTEEALNVAQAFQNGLIDVLWVKLEDLESDKKDKHSWSPCVLTMFEIVRVRRSFKMAMMEGDIDDHVEALARDSITHNLGTHHHRWISQLEWVNPTIDKQNRNTCCMSLLNHFEAYNRTEDALIFMQNETRFSHVVRIGHFNRIVDRLLTNGAAYAWDLMRMQQPPEVTVEETEVANIALQMAEKYLQNGEIQEACNIMADNLMFTDPATNILRFPEQAMRFFELLSNHPDDILSKINQKCAAAFFAAAKSPVNEADIEPVLSRLIILLPDNAKKLELIQKAIKRGGILFNTVLDPVLTASQNALQKRPVQLYKLACIFLKDGDLERFWSITRNFTSSALLFGCLNQLLDQPKILSLSEHLTEFLKISNTLPDEYKFLLIEQAKTKKRADIFPLLESQFNRLALKQRAEKEFQITLGFDQAFGTIGSKMIKQGVTSQDIERLYLLAWDTETLTLFEPVMKSAFLEAAKNDVKLKSALESLDQFSNLRFRSILYCTSLMRGEKFSKDHTTTAGIFALPVALQIGILRHLKNHIKHNQVESNLRIILEPFLLALQNNIEASGKGEQERLEKEHVKVAVVSDANELIPGNERGEVMQSDLLISAMVLEEMKKRFLVHGEQFELEAVGITAESKQIRERRIDFLHCSDVIIRWSFRHFEVRHIESRRKVEFCIVRSA